MQSSWGIISFYCMNPVHAHPVPLRVKNGKEGESDFYVCPKYMKKDKNHPEGWDEGELACHNNISINSLLKIKEAYDKITSNNMMGNIDYTGTKFKIPGGIECKILRYIPGRCADIGILNNRAIHA